MTRCSWLVKQYKGGMWLGILLLLGSLLLPVAAQAQGGIAISGSFSQQDFRIPQGSSVHSPNVDVVVFNNDSGQIQVKVTSQAPRGVTLTLSRSDLTIGPGKYERVVVGVEVSTSADPGEHEISVAAQSYREGVSGIQIVGAARQVAKLTVVGASARVTLKALSPSGDPLTATVRLFRVVDEQHLDVAFSDQGTLTAVVAPGDFLASAYVGGEEAASQKFSVAEGDNKEIALTAATLYFAAFDLVPNTQDDNGRLAFVEVAYTLKNLYQKVSQAEVLLQVKHDGTDLPAASITKSSSLDTGSMDFSYNYIPKGGWSNGQWDFQLQLMLEGKLYAASPVQNIAVKNGAIGAPVSSTAPSGSTSENSNATSSAPLNPALIGGIAAAAVIIIAVLLFVLRRRKA